MDGSFIGFEIGDTKGICAAGLKSRFVEQFALSSGIIVCPLIQAPSPLQSAAIVRSRELQVTFTVKVLASSAIASGGSSRVFGLMEGITLLDAGRVAAGMVSLRTQREDHLEVAGRIGAPRVTRREPNGGWRRVAPDPPASGGVRGTSHSCGPESGTVLRVGCMGRPETKGFRR
ncbi:hypothetical protein PQJ75_23165 [Rhodoplanes sp. TEM]|uniref:Uncharacterized protein n=1 Tax=Rhodoplanes tepidamans TaxID=200616 RepID=A0ABT5JJ51_RHOTP|nr:MULTISPECIES: hypothetical protein [Rhodoplanes]MDC7789617.1 hypothetical protein [Rhodoplanes tepidamans]MDC7986639.1 hypothetical protein [Rhodoplanes sp. TEM]MDQ0354033.1 hypothetical protein [Rhodoplanes tepidamans]